MYIFSEEISIDELADWKKECINKVNVAQRHVVISAPTFWSAVIEAFKLLQKE